MTTRSAFGGLYAWYYTNQGTKHGIEFWEDVALKNIKNPQLHARWIVELLEGFNHNR